MEVKSHGLRVGLERHGNNIFLTLKATGKLTHQDYQTMLPMLESALQSVENPEIDALIDGTELEGWEPRAAWDDLKLGLKHGSKFRKIAIYGNKDWQETFAKVGDWFTSGEVKFFEDIKRALSWLNDELDA
ncbi:SpoIIAA family protein [Kangiella sediminilitoris]|uniref:STAS/SEC14 domain-containing protein n=1 Tax=Kangiella sediminilitoris TaxID=1144748 RepID=A0A1B3BC54_9GAMM|nr:STAS/SEC14 domain-containing protein [Kangiella sediminilitoris]AOE50380.1 hypothetical protein KS2013_1670 [Kangiella sediminilitoris]